MKIKLEIRTIVICCALCGLPASAGAKDDSSQLLDQSYGLSSKLENNERYFYLQELTRISTGLAPPPKNAEEWCLKLFRLAATESDQRIRITAEKNAVWRLSFFNPALAMNLLRQIDIPQPSQGEMLYEDLRSAAAEGIFTNFLTKRKPHGLSTIISEAVYLGETGQYPYRAMAAVIQHLPHPLRKRINDIVSDALSFYVHENGFFNRDEEFLFFLQALKKADVTKDLMVRVVETFVRRLTLNPMRTRGDYFSEILTGKATSVVFHDRNQAFLFQAFPIIRDYHPSLAAQLLYANPTLAEATDEMQYLSGGFVMGNSTTEQARQQQHTQWIQESLLDRVRRHRTCDPKFLMPIVQRLSSPSARITGFSWIIPGIVRQDPSQAHNIYQQQILELRDLGDRSDQLNAKIALAEAANALGDSQNVLQFSKQALDLGIDIFGRDLKARTNLRIQRHSGFEQLHEIVTFIASQPVDSINLKIQIQRLPNSWLKAYLLLYEAEGRAKSQLSSNMTSPCSN